MSTEITDTSLDQNGLTMLPVVSTSSQQQIIVEMEFSRKPVKLELETGASVTIMSEEIFGRLFPGK